MKRITFLSISLVSALFCSTACGGNNGRSASDSDTGLAVAPDSLMIDTVSTEKSPVMETVVTDAICLDVKGNVSKLEHSLKSGLYNPITVYEFSNDGHLTKTYMKDSGVEDSDIKMERDAGGRPVKLIMKVEDEMGDEQDYIVTFSYDKENRLVKEHHENYDSSWNSTYKRDSEGKVTEMIVSDPFGGSEKTTYTYPADAFDSHGNWTKRIETSGSEKSEVTRKINYR